MKHSTFAGKRHISSWMKILLAVLLLMLFPLCRVSADSTDNQAKVEAMLRGCLYQPTEADHTLEAEMTEIFTPSLKRPFHMDLNRIYRYNRTRNDFLIQYRLHGHFNGLWTDSVIYNYMSEDAEINLFETNGRLDMGDGFTISPDDPGVIPQPEILARQIAAQVPDVKELHLIMVPIVRLHLVYLRAAGGEYLIAYEHNNAKQMDGLVNGKVYRVKDAMGRLINSLDERYIDRHQITPEIQRQFNMPAIRLKWTVLICCAAFLDAVIAYAILTVLFRRERERKTGDCENFRSQVK